MYSLMCRDNILNIETTNGRGWKVISSPFMPHFCQHANSTPLCTMPFSLKASRHKYSRAGNSWIHCHLRRRIPGKRRIIGVARWTTGNGRSHATGPRTSWRSSCPFNRGSRLQDVILRSYLWSTVVFLDLRFADSNVWATANSKFLASGDDTPKVKFKMRVNGVPWCLSFLLRYADSFFFM